MCYLCYMGRRFWSQIAVILLAVQLCLFIWLGYWAFLPLALIAVAMIVVWIVRKRSCKNADNKAVRAVVAPQLKDRETQAIEARKEQGRNIFGTLHKMVALNPEAERVVNRLLEWYGDYLKSNGIYHTSPYDYLLQRIKERANEAKAAYLKRELVQSKVIVRAMMRGASAEQILESIEEYDS